VLLTSGVSGSFAFPSLAFSLGGDSVTFLLPKVAIQKDRVHFRYGCETNSERTSELVIVIPVDNANIHPCRLANIIGVVKTLLNDF
jgi:hypothetical protein